LAVDLERIQFVPVAGRVVVEDAAFAEGRVEFPFGGEPGDDTLFVLGAGDGVTGGKDLAVGKQLEVEDFARREWGAAEVVDDDPAFSKPRDEVPFGIELEQQRSVFVDTSDEDVAVGEDLDRESVVEVASGDVDDADPVRGDRAEGGVRFPVLGHANDGKLEL